MGKEIAEGMKYVIALNGAVEGQLTQIAQTLDGMRTNLQTITQGQAQAVTARARGEGAARSASDDQARARAMMEKQLREAIKDMPAEEANKEIAEGLATLETKSTPSFAGRQAAAQTQAQARMHLTEAQAATINGIRADMAQYKPPNETPTTSDLTAALAKKPGGRTP